MSNESAAIMFSDVSGSSRLFKEVGDAEARAIISKVVSMMMNKTQAQNGTVIKTIGDEVMASFPTAQAALNAVKEADIEVLSYSHSAGFLSYREKLAAYYGKQGIAIEPSDIIISTGGSEALMFAMGSVTDPGDEIIIPEPFYANYNGFATASGVVVKPVISSFESGFALPPISEFEKQKIKLAGA